MRTALPLLRDLKPLVDCVVRCPTCYLLVLHVDLCMTQEEADFCMSPLEPLLTNTDGPRRSA